MKNYEKGPADPRSQPALESSRWFSLPVLLKNSFLGRQPIVSIPTCTGLTDADVERVRDWGRLL